MTVARDLEFRSPQDCRYDIVALGEVMLRLDPGVDRVRTASQFRVTEGGGEYNVARAMSSCFGLRSAIVTSLVDNEVGALIDSLIQRGGVDLAFRQLLPFDGVGRRARNPLNFVERGFGVRAALGVSDRGHSATGLMQPGDVDWEYLFGTLGVRCLHTGGIFTALSPSAAAVAEAAMQAARKYGTRVSYDLNYRASLWQDAGGEQAATALNHRLLPFVDVLIGLQTPATGSEPGQGESIEPEQTIDALVEGYPNLTYVASTLRTNHSASRNDWSALGWSKVTGILRGRTHHGLEIFDRVGGGDGFSAGFLYGLLEAQSLHRAIELGAAHGALVMTTPGDTSSATLAEVQDLADQRKSVFRR